MTKVWNTSFAALGAIALREISEQRCDEEHGQDVPHPVEAEALATFVADDVANLAGNPRVRVRRRRDVAHRISFTAASVGMSGRARNRKYGQRFWPLLPSACVAGRGRAQERRFGAASSNCLHRQFVRVAPGA